MLKVWNGVAASKGAVSGRASRERAYGRTAKVLPRGLATERKYITIMRTDLHRSTDLLAGLELEESIARLAPALDEMRAAVHQHHGIIHQELGDGLFAVFGAPVADDLHAVRACFAALDLLRRIKVLGDPGFQVRIGVHSGLVVAGPRKLDYTRSYDFHGPPMIMAERLQAVAAPGQALASESCRALAEGYIRFGLGEARALKGFPQAVVMHPIEGVGELSKWRVSVARGTAAFVGRDAEAARLRALAEASEADGSGTAVVLSGEPGVGKSRLAHETVTALRGRSWQVIEAECSPILGQSPFALLKDLLSDIAAGLGEARMMVLRAELAPVQVAALEVVLHGAKSDSVPAWAELTPRARGRAVVEAARALAQSRIGRQKTVLLIEDLQWADEASATAVEAIIALADRLPVLVVATARTGGVPHWLERRAPVRLLLMPLERPAGLAMLDQLLGPSPRLAPLKARILSHTGALPLFIEEVCRDLAEVGALTGAWGAFEPAAAEAELRVPLTVQGVIASRIDRLSRPEKRLLQIAAAVGPVVPQRLLQVVSTLQETVFREGLTALLAAAMLVPAPEAAEAANAFPHELVRQVAYDAVLGSNKVALHRRILAELEAEGAAGRGGPDLAAALVHHALKAQEWSRAAEYAAAIARQCLAQSALPDAVRYFEAAMGAVDRLPASALREARAIDLRIEARLAYANFGKVTRWLDLAKEAEARAQEAGDGLRRVAALAVRAAALNFCGAPMEAQEAGEAAVREAARTGEPGWLGYAEYGLGQARYVAGRYREAVELLGRAHERFTVGGASPPVGGSRLQLALLCCMMTCIAEAARGAEAEATAAQRRADAIATRDGRAFHAMAAGFSRGVLLLHLDEAEAAEATLARAVGLARQHEVNLFVPVVACHHGRALLRLGRGEDARLAFQVARKEADILGHHSIELRAELGLALCDAVVLGGRAAALKTVRGCGRTALQQGYEPLEMEALLIEAALLGTAEAEFSARAQSAAESIAARLGAAGAQREVAQMLAQVLEPSGRSAGLA